MRDMQNETPIIPFLFLSRFYIYSHGRSRRMPFPSKRANTFRLVYVLVSTVRPCTVPDNTDTQDLNQTGPIRIHADNCYCDDDEYDNSLPSGIRSN